MNGLKSCKIKLMMIIYTHKSCYSEWVIMMAIEHKDKGKGSSLIHYYIMSTNYILSRPNYNHKGLL